MELRETKPNPPGLGAQSLCPLLSPPQSLLDVFVEMEKRLILGEDNLDTLKSIFDHVNKSQMRYIEEFEESNRGRRPMAVR